jgi:hypothetical protein
VAKSIAVTTFMRKMNKTHTDNVKTSILALEVEKENGKRKVGEVHGHLSCPDVNGEKGCRNLT